MYNEMLFLAHVLVVSGSVFFALKHSFKALLAVLSLQLILANLFVTKQVVLFGIPTTCSEVFVVSGMYGITLVREYWGMTVARRAVWVTFGFLLFFVLSAQFHLAYQGVDMSIAQAVAGVFDTSLRLFVASVTAYLISERAHLGASLLFRRLPAAAVLAVMVGQLVDTLTFAYLGLYGLVEDIKLVILFCLLVKVAIALLLSPLIFFTKRFIPRFPQEASASGNAGL